MEIVTAEARIVHKYVIGSVFSFSDEGIMLGGNAVPHDELAFFVLAFLRDEKVFIRVGRRQISGRRVLCRRHPKSV